jgi:hypothetical protein
MPDQHELRKTQLLRTWVESGTVNDFKAALRSSARLTTRLADADVPLFPQSGRLTPKNFRSPAEKFAALDVVAAGIYGRRRVGAPKPQEASVEITVKEETGEAEVVVSMPSNGDERQELADEVATDVNVGIEEMFKDL